MFQNPDPDTIRALLKGAGTIAVVGYSPRTDRPSHRIASALRGAGYRVIAVRPGISEALGERAYPNLRAVPDSVDIIDVFRASEHAAEVIDDCIAKGAKVVWFQDGVYDEPAGARAQAAGMTVIMDRCIWRDHRALVR